jgi:peptide/nickel transport system substrate-binding protein
MRSTRLVSRPTVALAALAVAVMTMLTACGGSTSTSGVKLGVAGAFGAVPAATGTPHGGTVRVAAPANTSANWILPIITGADNSVFNVLSFDFELYRPLYFETSGVTPEVVPSMSLAGTPEWSNGDRTVTLTLASNYRWSDGSPVTSRDVLFWFDEVKAALKISAANWAPYTPGLGIPDEVADVSTPNASTVVFNLTKPVNPSWFADDELSAIQPMPSHAWAKASASGPILDFTNPANAAKIYAYLAAQSKNLSTYATNPLWSVVDGPYRLTSFNITNGAFTMTPNATYGGPHAKVYPTLQLVPFTSDTAEVNAVKAGSVDVGYMPLQDIAQLRSVEASGYAAFGFPTFGWTYIAYNFKDTSGDFDHIIGQLYIREAIAHLEDQAGYIKAFLGGAGGQAYGPVPSIPASPYTPANAAANPYPFSLSDATSLLRNHGWTITPGGTDTCAKPGTAAGECGAGIPKGTALAWTLASNANSATISQEDEALTSEASKAGIQIHLTSSNFNFLVQNYNDPAAPTNDSKWAMEDFGGFTDGTYPTTFGVFNSGGSANLGGYADPKADRLITASVSSSNPTAVKAEASYLTAQQPGLFQPNSDAGGNGSCVIVWKKDLSGQPASFENLTQFDLTPEFWYFTK